MANHNLIQWNTRNIKNKKHELVYLIKSYNPVIFAISETWLRPGALFRVTGYSCLRDDRDDGWAGSALLVRRNFRFSQLTIPPHSPGLNVVAVRALNISFVSVYIPHPTPALIQELTTILASLPAPLIVQGDFNCRHTLWGSHCCDPISSYILDLADVVNLCILNDGTPTRRTSPLQNPSVPDLTLASPNLIHSLSWTVTSNSLGSDHLPIVITLLNSSIHTPPSQEPLLKYRLRSADWNEFRDILNIKIENIPPVTKDNYLFVYRNFIEALTSAADGSIPLKNTAREKVTSPAWWDAECSAIIKERKKAESLFAADLSMEKYVDFQRISARSKRLLSSKKKLGWKTFCEGLSPRTPSSVV